MNQSLFIQYVEKWFHKISQRISETINGKKEAPKYLHEEMLTEEYSADLTWDSSSVDSSIVAADVVAMDSPLPLKARDSISTAHGKIPKIGMKMHKGEKLITDMQIMSARGAKEAEVVAKLFADAPRCAKGVKERVEIMFQQGLSTGMTLVPDEENVGTAVRADFGFLDKNKYGATIPWGKPGYTPITDIANVLSNADDTITVLMCRKSTYNLIRKSEEGKMLSANFRGLVITDNAKLPVPTPSQFDEAMADEHKVSFKVIDRVFKVEKNGKRTKVQPFDENAVVFLPSLDVGRLVYGTLAEETNNVAGVAYEKVGSYILLSKYSKNDPLREFTSAQALVLPVIDNVDSIYLLNHQEAQEVADDETEGDTTVTIYGKQLTKADVIAAVKSLGVKCAANISDAKLIEKINELNDENEAKLKETLNIAAE